MNVAECAAINGGLKLDLGTIIVDLGTINTPDVPGTAGNLVIQVSGLAGQLLHNAGVQVGSFLGNLSL